MWDGSIASCRGLSGPVFSALLASPGLFYPCHSPRDQGANLVNGDIKGSEYLTFKRAHPGTFLMVQWLRFHLPTQAVQVRSPAGELRTHMPLSQKPKHKQQKQYCHNFNKNFKNGPYQKKLPECQWAEPIQFGSENHAEMLRSTVSHLRGRKTRNELMAPVFLHEERKLSQVPM